MLKRTPGQAEPARANISFGRGLKTAVKDTDFVLGAAADVLSVKVGATTPARNTAFASHVLRTEKPGLLSRGVSGLLLGHGLLSFVGAGKRTKSPKPPQQPTSNDL